MLLVQLRHPTNIGEMTRAEVLCSALFLEEKAQELLLSALNMHPKGLLFAVLLLSFLKLVHSSGLLPWNWKLQLPALLRLKAFTRWITAYCCGVCRRRTFLPLESLCALSSIPYRKSLLNWRRELVWTIRPRKCLGTKAQRNNTTITQDSRGCRFISSFLHLM